METTQVAVVHTGREDALRIRRHIINQITAPPVLEAIGQFGRGREHRAGVIARIDDGMRADLTSELLGLHTWQEEHWILNEDESVSPATEIEFVATPGTQRFSNSDSLRAAPREAMATRALMSALKSSEVGSAFSAAYGSTITFRTADIARYRLGHYLRRHSDTYEDRVFGLVFFLADGWQQAYGGQLIVEYPDGRVHVIAPDPADVVVLPIAPGYWHMVSEVTGRSWERLSVAAHFGID